MALLTPLTRSPVGPSDHLLTVNDHELLLDLTCELLPTLGAVRISTHSPDPHVLRRQARFRRLSHTHTHTYAHTQAYTHSWTCTHPPTHTHAHTGLVHMLQCGNLYIHHCDGEWKGYIIWAVILTPFTIAFHIVTKHRHKWGRIDCITYNACSESPTHSQFLCQ